MSKELIKEIRSRFYNDYNRIPLTTLQVESIVNEYKGSKLTICGITRDVSRDSENNIVISLENKIIVKFDNYNSGETDDIALEYDVKSVINGSNLDALKIRPSELLEVEGFIQHFYSYSWKFGFIISANSFRSLSHNWLSTESIGITKPYDPHKIERERYWAEMRKYNQNEMIKVIIFVSILLLIIISIITSC